MRKIVFFDLDDCIVESSPLIQASFDEKTNFKNDKLLSLEYTLAICKEVLERNSIEISRAMERGEKPKLVGNIRIGCNDIIKTRSGNSELDELAKQKRRYETWYQIPLEMSRRACGDAYWNKEMFLEERDHFLEEDNQVTNGAIVDYNQIYVENNLTPGAVETIKEIIESGEYEGCYCLSHHNGGREEVCKKDFIDKTFDGKLEFLGLRFHIEHYQEGRRRPRSSKALHIMHKFNLPDLVGCVLVDDSTANLEEWVKYGGMAVLYRPMSEDEEYMGKLEPHSDKYPRITEMSKENIDEALKFYSSKKKLVKKGEK